MENSRFKFRVWDKRNKLWVESMSMCNFGFLTMQNGTDIEEDGFNEDDLLIEQCTGLKDKNGRLIYEGDILGYCGNSISVVWDNDYPSFKLYGKDGSYYGRLHQSYIINYAFEIIGNIHENPELVKE